MKLLRLEKNEFITPENIKIDTKVIEIDQIHAYLKRKLFLVHYFGGDLEKWPPSRIFKWPVGWILLIYPWKSLCQIRCLCHNLHDCSLIRSTIYANTCSEANGYIVR